MALRPGLRAQRQEIERADTSTAGAKSESGWACNKQMLPSFRPSSNEIWDRKDTWDSNLSVVSQLDRILDGFGVAPASFQWSVRMRRGSEKNVT